MTERKNSQAVLRSPRQIFAKLLHRLKARLRSKEKRRIGILGRLISDNSTIIDVGANFGYFCKEFARIHQGSCQVHAFEPTSYNYDILSSVCTRFSNVVLNKLALSDSEGTVSINIPIKKRGTIGPALAHMGTDTLRDYISEEIRTVTLDQYMTDAGLDRLDLIKCDVEGAELLVFRGGQESIARHKPVVFTEINEAFTRRMGYEPADIFELFLPLGYRACIMEEDLSLSAEVDQYTHPADYLFVPPGKTFPGPGQN